MTIPRFSSMPGLPALFAAGHRRDLEQGQALFRQNDPADRLFLIERGRLRMVRHLASGEAVALHTGQAGELFAEGALFSRLYRCDALALESATVTACTKVDVLAALANSPGLASEMLERVTGQLHAARTLLELRNIRSAEERALRHLRLHADAAGLVAFDRPLLDVAADLGLTHEAYYRALAALGQRGAIERNGRRIRLLRPARSLHEEVLT